MGQGIRREFEQPGASEGGVPGRRDKTVEKAKTTAASASGAGSTSKPRSFAPGKSSSTAKGKGPVKVKKEFNIYEDPDVAMLGLHPSIKQEDGGFISSDEDSDSKTRVNIDNPIIINSDDDDDDHVDESDQEDDAMASRKIKTEGQFPVRVTRHQHVERSIGINTDASASTVTGNKRRPKKDPDDEDGIPIPRKNKGKGKKIISIKPEDKNTTAEPETVELSDNSEMSEPPPEVGVKPTAARRTKVPPGATEDEIRELEIADRETDILLQELGKVTLGPQSEAGLAEEKDVKEAKPPVVVEGKDPRENNVYLFQLPPNLPDLIPLKGRVKKEKAFDAKDKRNDIKKKDASNNDMSFPESQEAEEVSEVKIEDDSSGRQRPVQETDGVPNMHAGRVGKLRVHKSGKTTLDWGGISMKLNMGVDAYFLQSALLTEVVPGEVPDGEVSGNAISFGQVRGKFVVTPDWSEILER